MEEEEFKQGDEFKVGALNEAVKRRKLEGVRQGRDSYRTGHADEDYNDPDSPKHRHAQFVQNLIETTQIQDRLTQAQLATARALEAAQKRELAAKDWLSKLNTAATKDEQGRAVYLTADRTRAFAEDGTELTDEQIKDIHWKTDAPTWEQHQDAAGEVEQAIKDREEIEDYQEKLAHGRDSIESDSLTEEELHSIEDDLAAMPESVRSHLGSMPEPASPPDPPGKGIIAAPLSPRFLQASIPSDHQELTQPPLTPQTLDL